MTFSENYVGPWQRMYHTHRSTPYFADPVAPPRVSSNMVTVAGLEAGRNARLESWRWPDAEGNFPVTPAESQALWRHGRWWNPPSFYEEEGGISSAPLPAAGTPMPSVAVGGFGNLSTAYLATNARLVWETRGVNRIMHYQDRGASAYPTFTGAELAAAGAVGVEYWTPELDDSYDGDPPLIYDRFTVHGWAEAPWQEYGWTYQPNGGPLVERKAEVRLFVRLNTAGTFDPLMNYQYAGFSTQPGWMEIQRGQDTELPVAWLNIMAADPQAKLEISFVHDKVYDDTWPGDYSKSVMYWVGVDWDASVSYYSGAYRFLYDPPTTIEGGLKGVRRAFVG